jgi:hypothetical protein
VSDQTARRRLEDLRAAINAYHAEHTLSRRRASRGSD